METIIKRGEKNKTRKNKKPSAIDVQALLHSGSNKSLKNRTMAAMTTEEQAKIIRSAEKALMKEAKKGLRKEAMKVCSYMT